MYLTCVSSKLCEFILFKMFGYRLERRFSEASASTAVKIPQLWTSSLDRDVSTTKLRFQNISILLGPAGDSGGNQAAASGFPFFFYTLLQAAVV